MGARRAARSTQQAPPHARNTKAPTSLAHSGLEAAGGLSIRPAGLQQQQQQQQQW
jgi:hypothetical protein